MATQIIISSKKFLGPFNNGINFDQNLSDFTTNLAGSVMEGQKAIYQFDVSWQDEASASNKWDIEVTGTTSISIRKASGDFKDSGFSTGDTLDFSHVNNGDTNTFAGTVTNLTDGDTLLIISFASITLSSAEYASAKIRGTTPLTALQYTFGLIDNNEVFNVESKVTGNAQGYYSGDIGIESGGVRSSVFVDMDSLGKYEDWLTGSMRARYVNNPDVYTQRFEVEHIFIINPYYVEGELSNLQNNIVPELLADLNSLKYAFNAEFRTVLSNPNTKKDVTEEDNLGSVGWLNINFAGFDNFYSVDSVIYQDALSGNSADGLLVGSQTKVTVTVSSTKTFSGTDRFGVLISKLSTALEYTDKTTTFKENFIFDSAYNNVGASNTGGLTIISNLTGSIVGPDLVIVFFVEYTIANQLVLDNTTNYLIGIQVGDEALSSGNSDRVVLIGDVNTYDQNADIPGLIAFNKLDFYQENQIIGVGSGTTDGIVWPQDDLALDFNFQLDLNKDAVLNTLDFSLLAFNVVTQENFILDTYSYPISGAVISSGVQQLEVDTTRGYPLVAGDQFNKVTLTTGTNTAGIQEYDGIFAQKFSWQDYSANLLANPVFFDATKPNNNLNDLSFNYSNLNNYHIRIGVSANLSGTNTLGQSGLTDYLILSPNIIVNDYDDDFTGNPQLSAVITTEDPDTSTDLGGDIIVGGPTIMRVTYTDAGGPVTALTGIWGWHEIQPFEQNGYGQEKISTESIPPTNNLLIPLAGETELKIFIDSGNIVTECLIDGTLISEGDNYTISGRIESTLSLPGVPSVDKDKITEVGVLKETETSDQKVVE